VVGVSRSGRVPEGARGVSADLLDPAAARRAVGEAAPDVVYHLAGQAHVGRSWQEPLETLQLNAGTTLNVLEAVRASAPEARVIVVGSGEEYGPPAALPVGEDAPLRPQTPYAAAKAASELLADVYAEVHDLTVLRTRSFNHAGPGQDPSFAVSSFSRQLAAGRLRGENPVRITTGSPRPRRDFTDVRDVARAYRLLAQGADPGIYNVCSGRAVAVSELVSALGEVAGVEVDHAVDPELVREHEVMEIRGSHERLTQATGWHPEIPLAQTLADTVAWWEGELRMAGVHSTETPE
jgi:GDP-4-dehydro-6-deoxy-D-mannose reductase